MRTEPANCGGGSVITATSRQDVEAAFAIAQLSEREPLCGLRTTNVDCSPPRFSHLRTAVMPLTSSRVERAGVKRKLDWQADRLSKQSRLHEVEVDEVQRAIETERNSFISSRRHQHLPSSTAEDSELVGRFIRTCGPGSREDGAMEQQLYVKVRDKTTSCLDGAVVERRTRDRKVAGSTPGWGAIKSTRSTQPSIPLG